MKMRFWQELKQIRSQLTSPHQSPVSLSSTWQMLEIQLKLEQISIRLIPMVKLVQPLLPPHQKPRKKRQKLKHLQQLLLLLRLLHLLRFNNKRLQSLHPSQLESRTLPKKHQLQLPELELRLECQCQE